MHQYKSAIHPRIQWHHGHVPSAVSHPSFNTTFLFIPHSLHQPQDIVHVALFSIDICLSPGISITPLFTKSSLLHQRAVGHIFPHSNPAVLIVGTGGLPKIILLSLETQARTDVCCLLLFPCKDELCLHRRLPFSP
jgi:hypothetical protein